MPSSPPMAQAPQEAEAEAGAESSASANPYPNPYRALCAPVCTAADPLEPLSTVASLVYADLTGATI